MRSHGSHRCVDRLWLIQHGCQAAAEGGRDRERDARLLAHEIEKGAAVQTQNLAIGLGLDGGGPRAVGEKGHFPEWFAGLEGFHPGLRRTASAGGVDAYRTGRDQIEGISRFSLPEDDRA
jgi:hypothetical protein